MKLHAAVATLVLAASLTGASAQLQTFSPDQVGDAFCIASLAGDMAPVEAGLLTPALADAVADAELRNATIQAQAPGDKPPLGDGLPWRSFPDYADGCIVGAIALTPDATAATVEIHYSFKDYPDASYTDTLRLKQTDGTDRFYRIDDIALLDGQTFSGVLAAIFE